MGEGLLRRGPPDQERHSRSSSAVKAFHQGATWAGQMRPTQTDDQQSGGHACSLDQWGSGGGGERQLGSWEI